MRHFCAVLTILLAGVPASALDTSKLKPRGYVNDFANVLDSAGAQKLESYCAQVEKATGVQIAIVTVKSLDQEPIEYAAARLFKEWGIGKKGSDEGLLLMLSINDRKQRAEVGYGLEPIITDGFSGGVLRGIRPLLRQGDYSGALLAATQEFAGRIAESKGVHIESSTPTPPPAYAPAEPVGIPWPIIIIGLVILFAILRSRGGGGGGFWTGIILGNILGSGRRGGGWGGGGFGGGGLGGGGGGFGGFGGGGSGGGGASGDW
jgi:uncharacterized protein